MLNVFNWTMIISFGRLTEEKKKFEDLRTKHKETVRLREGETATFAMEKQKLALDYENEASAHAKTKALRLRVQSTDSGLIQTAMTIHVALGIRFREPRTKVTMSSSSKSSLTTNAA